MKCQAYAQINYKDGEPEPIAIKQNIFPTLDDLGQSIANAYTNCSCVKLYDQFLDLYGIYYNPKHKQ